MDKSFKRYEIKKIDLWSNSLSIILFIIPFFVCESKGVENSFYNCNEIVRRVKEGTDSEWESLLRKFGFESKRFQRFHDLHADGKISLEENIVSSERIEKYLEGDVIYPAEYKGKEEARQIGERIIKEGKLAVIIVKGGMHTRFMGGGVDKGIMPMVLDNGSWKSFVEIHLERIKQTQDELQGRIITILSNSYLTYATTAEYLKANNNFGLGENLWNVYQIGIDERLIPTPADLQAEFDRKQTQMKPWEREVASGQLEAEKEMVTKWVEEAKARGDRYPYVYHPLGIDEKTKLYPTGHINVVFSLFMDGTLRRLIHEGAEYIMTFDASNLFNIYELGLNIDPLLLGIWIKSNRAMMSEFTDRGIDAGGLLARVDGRIRILEEMTVEPEVTLEKDLDLLSSFIHYINIDGLVQAFGFKDKDDFLMSPEQTVSEKLKAALNEIPFYTVLRRIAELLPDGRAWGIPVIGFEQTLGDLPLLLSKDNWLGVYIQRGNYRDGRFLPIKTLEDLAKVNNR